MERCPPPRLHWVPNGLRIGSPQEGRSLQLLGADPNPFSRADALINIAGVAESAAQLRGDQGHLPSLLPAQCVSLVYLRLEGKSLRPAVLTWSRLSVRGRGLPHADTG
jgi:hypothetical protein